jgi:hypothetical protein
MVNNFAGTSEMRSLRESDRAWGAIPPSRFFCIDLPDIYLLCRMQQDDSHADAMRLVFFRPMKAKKNRPEFPRGGLI